VPEDENISKAELRLTDIAEYLDDDWILLARQLHISRQEIIKIQSEYSYVTEQVFFPSFFKRYLQISHRTEFTDYTQSRGTSQKVFSCDIADWFCGEASA